MEHNETKLLRSYIAEVGPTDRMHEANHFGVFHAGPDEKTFKLAIGFKTTDGTSDIYEFTEEAAQMLIQLLSMAFHKGSA